MLLIDCPKTVVFTVSYILIVRDAKLFAWLESFSSKFNCAMFETFGTVRPVF